MILWLLRILLTTLALVVVLLGAILILEPRLDLTPYGAFVGRQLSDWVGREIHLDGDIALTPGRRIRLEVRDLGIANPAWATSPRLLTASEAMIQVDLGALLGGLVHVEEFAVRGAEAHLEVSAAGDRSWHLGRMDATTARTSPNPSTQPASLSYLIEDTTAENLTVVYRGTEARRSLRLQLDQLRQRDQQGALVLDAAGRLNDLPLALAGHLGTLDALIARRGIDLDLRTQLGETLLTASGHLGEPDRLEDVHLRLRVQGPDLDQLFDHLEIPHAPQGDTDLTLNIIDRDRGFSWRARGHLGHLTLDSYGVAEEPLAWRGVAIRADLQGQELATLGKLLGLADLPRQPYRLTGEVRRDRQGLDFGQTTLQVGEARLTLEGRLPRFPELAEADVRVALAVPEAADFAALLPGAPNLSGPAKLVASLVPGGPGGVRLQAEATLADARLTLQGPLGHGPSYSGTGIDFALEGARLEQLPIADGWPDGSSTPFRLRGRLAVDGEGEVRLEPTTGSLGGIEMTVDGRLGWLPDLTDTNLTLRLWGDSMKEAARPLRDIELPALPFRIEARLLDRLSAPAIGNLRATLGSVRLELAGKLRQLPHLTGSDARFLAELPEIDAWLPHHWREYLPGGGYQITGQLQKPANQLLLQEVEVRGDALNLRLDAGLPEPLGLKGARLVISAAGEDLAAALQLASAYRPSHNPFELAAVLTGGDESVEVEALEIHSSEALLTGRGQFDWAAGPLSARLKFRALGEQLSRLGTIDAFPLPEGRFQVSAELLHSADRLELTDARIQLGEGKIVGSLRVQRQERPYVALEVTAEAFDIAALLPPTPGTVQAQQSESAAAIQGDRLIPDLPLGLDWLDRFDGRFELSAEGLEFPQGEASAVNLVREFRLAATLDRGRLEIAELHLAGDRGDMAARGSLAHADGSVAIDALLAGERLRFGVAREDLPFETLPAHDLDLAVKARGRSLHALVGSLNGRLRFAAGPGTIDHDTVEEALGPALGELLEALAPFAEHKPRSRLECGAGALRFVEGVVKADPGVLLRTERADIAAEGTLDLTNERLDLLIASRRRDDPQRGMPADGGSVARVVGTLLQPGIIVGETDPQAAGRAAGSEAASGPVRLLDRFGAAREPCAQIFTEAGEHAAAPLSSQAADARLASPDAR